MTVHSSQIGGTAGATAALKSTSASKKSTGTSFSAALKDAGTTAESTTSAKKAPAGEKTRTVDGHKYADVIVGPRKGMYINTGSNSRSGEAFVMVKKNGREYHIYGTGENRRVIGLKPAGDKDNDAVSSTGTSSTDTSATPTGTTGTGKINTDASTTN
jgi:hypothetical protein